MECLIGWDDESILQLLIQCFTADYSAYKDLGENIEISIEKSLLKSKEPKVLLLMNYKRLNYKLYNDWAVENAPIFLIFIFLLKKMHRFLLLWCIAFYLEENFELILIYFMVKRWKGSHVHIEIDIHWSQNPSIT